MVRIGKPDFLSRLGWLICALLGLGGVLCGVQMIRSFNLTKIVIEWSTQSELGIAGYNLRRGESPDGPFIQINSQIIPSSEDPLVGGEYSFEDTGLKPGATYYYVLEDVDVSGASNQHGPVTQTAKNLSWGYLLLTGFLVLSAGFCTWMQVRIKGQSVR